MAKKGSFVESTAEASVGGYAGIKKVRGLLVSIEKIPPKPDQDISWEPKEQLEFKLEDAAVLEMFPNSDQFELKDGKFTGWVPYAAEGKTPSTGSTYIKCWVASAEAVGKKPTAMIGEYITLERQDRKMFSTSKMNEDTGEKEKIEVRSINTTTGLPSSGSWCFVSDETSDSETVLEYVKGKVLGLNEKAAKRELLTDARAKQFPEFKEALNSGELGDKLGIKLGKDGVFVEK